MTTELDDMLARTDRAIAKLSYELRIEERVRERILEEQLAHKPHIPATTKLAGDPQTDANAGPRPKDSLVEGSLASRIVGILRAAGRPMKAKDIASKVQEQGFTTDAKAGLLGAVASRLSRGMKAGTFIRKGRGQYALKSPSPQETT